MSLKNQTKIKLSVKFFTLSIYRFKFRLRELENQMKFLDDEKILLSQNISYILDEMSKFKEII